MSAPQAGAPTPGERDRAYDALCSAGLDVDVSAAIFDRMLHAMTRAIAAARAEAYAAGLEAARNEEQESLRRIAVQASALGDCECSEEIGELCNRCALVDIIGRRIAAIRALAGADQKGARG